MTNQPGKKAVIFDRDGTLIVDKIYLNNPDEIEYLPGVFSALRLLRDTGFVFAVATNQSGVARGIVDVRNLDEIHRRMRAKFASCGIDILSFHSAPFMTNTDHPLRKPNPGMLLEAIRWHGIDPKVSWMVGDRLSDVEAGHAAGMKGALLSEAPDISGAPDILAKAHIEIIGPDLLHVARKIIESD
jgi:D-glycero-D-manno-heptose 1,7-bisphosphate phosphatase